MKASDAIDNAQNLKKCSLAVQESAVKNEIGANRPIRTSKLVIHRLVVHQLRYPYTPEEYGLDKAVELYSQWLDQKLIEDPAFLDPLKDKDLACWCPLTKSYHSDILFAAISELNNS